MDNPWYCPRGVVCSSFINRPPLLHPCRIHKAERACSWSLMQATKIRSLQRLSVRPCLLRHDFTCGNLRSYNTQLLIIRMTRAFYFWGLVLWQNIRLSSCRRRAIVPYVWQRRTSFPVWIYEQGHREFPFWKRKIPPRQRKNSRKFPFGKMLDFARSNTISTQTSNIYLN